MIKYVGCVDIIEECVVCMWIVFGYGVLVGIIGWIGGFYLNFVFFSVDGVYFSYWYMLLCFEFCFVICVDELGLY